MDVWWNRIDITEEVSDRSESNVTHVSDVQSPA